MFNCHCHICNCINNVSGPLSSCDREGHRGRRSRPNETIGRSNFSSRMHCPVRMAALPSESPVYRVQAAHERGSKMCSTRRNGIINPNFILCSFYTCFGLLNTRRVIRPKYRCNMCEKKYIKQIHSTVILNTYI
jgi:hypothetical protein